MNEAENELQYTTKAEQHVLCFEIPLTDSINMECRQQNRKQAAQLLIWWTDFKMYEKSKLLDSSEA